MTILTLAAKGLIALRRAMVHIAPGAGIYGFIGRLAGRGAKPLSLEDMDEAAASGWAGEK
ncbi:hypothetical protein FKB34_09045 [Glycocaulis profundi]|nr:hypothetical protein FKB34_09045 [Glycocaulis profundi]